jgi:hypothetical protein
VRNGQDEQDFSGFTGFHYSSFQMHATRFAFAMKKKNGTSGKNGKNGSYNGWLRVFRLFRLFRFSSSDAGDQVACK